MLRRGLSACGRLNMQCLYVAGPRLSVRLEDVSVIGGSTV